MLYANFVDPSDENEEWRVGKIAFQYEEGQWKFDCHIVTDGSNPYNEFASDEKALNLEEAIEYASK